MSIVNTANRMGEKIAIILCHLLVAHAAAVQTIYTYSHTRHTRHQFFHSDWRWPKNIYAFLIVHVEYLIDAPKCNAEVNVI